MIKQLKLKNYILIDELCANFDNGLNIITGETGAGKSIILNAIDLVFSARVSKEVIKNGCDKAIIEISLENTKHNLSQLFEENGIDNWGDEIVISKEITQNSVRSRINGTLVNQELLKSLRTLFVDIHSQHQTYTFLQPQYHINLLDSYAKDNYGDNLEIYKTKYKNYEELVKRLEQAKLISNETEAEIDFLKFQINEIEEANISSPTEDEELTKELDVLQNAEKLKELTSGAYWTINGDDGSIMEALTKLKSDISKASDLDNKLEEIQSNFIDAIENLRDISSSLRNYSQNLDNDTQRLDEIQERLYLLDKLKRKYGDSLEKVMENYENFSQKLSRIENLTGDIDTLEKDILTTKKELYSIAQAISEGRKKYSQILSGLIQEKLAALEMPKARFEIRITPKEDLSSNGIDDVEFMISTNVSEDLKPLAKVA
jgi:DNA repair protein RecN (Recombination protein N)